MKTVNIECDSCKKQLNECCNGTNEFRLVLMQEIIRNTSSIRYGISDMPPLNRDMHFCSIACISEWSAK